MRKILDGLYHIETGLPSIDFGGVKRITLRYSRHAIEQSQLDRYGQINLPNALEFKAAQLIELQIENGRLVKALFRVKYDATRDLCLVVKPDGFVKTVWVNLASDLHRTLDRSKYVALK